MDDSNCSNRATRIREHCDYAVLDPVPLGRLRSELVMDRGDGRFCPNRWMDDARLLGILPSIRRRAVTGHDPWVNRDIGWYVGPYLRSGGRVDDSNSHCNGRAWVAQCVLVANFQIA